MYEIIRLINQIPEIKKAFYLSENVGSFQCKLIYDTEVFLLWKENMKYELSKLSQETFITEFIELLDSFNGWGDVNNFAKLEAKVNTLKNNLSDFLKVNNEKQIFDYIMSVLLDIYNEDDDIYYVESKKFEFMSNTLYTTVTCSDGQTIKLSKTGANPYKFYFTFTHNKTANNIRCDIS